MVQSLTRLCSQYMCLLYSVTEMHRTPTQRCHIARMHHCRLHFSTLLCTLLCFCRSLSLSSLFFSWKVSAPLYRISSKSINPRLGGRSGLAISLARLNVLRANFAAAVAAFNACCIADSISLRLVTTPCHLDHAYTKGLREGQAM